MLLKYLNLSKPLLTSTARSFSTKYKLLEPMIEKQDMTYGLHELMNLSKNQQKVNEVISRIQGQLAGSKFEKEKYEKHIKGLYTHIKTTITNTEEKLLSSVADHYFQKEGKLIRPLINFGLAELVHAAQSSNKSFTESDSYRKQKDWASLVEILHISSLIHDDIIDKAPTRRGLISTHEAYGIRNACFGANFMIGRAVRKIAHMSQPQLFQIYATIMDNLTSGEYIQARKNKDFGNMEKLLSDYIIKSYYKTGSLISNSCRGVCLIAGEGHEVQSSAFKFGKHIGIAFQLVDDILDYTRTSQELGKEALSDLKEGVVTGPILLALDGMKDDPKRAEDLKTLTRICTSKDKSDSDIKTAANILEKTEGIEKIRWLAYMHVDKCVGHLEEILKSKELSKDDVKVKEPFERLLSLIFHVLSRNN